MIFNMIVMHIFEKHTSFRIWLENERIFDFIESVLNLNRHRFVKLLIVTNFYEMK